ncbi:hypothetical protein TWF225_002297 [Orbilia oligospora]|nr:hypothetical protein TWF225_002297 [Orbilia oligospora]KAF3240492.1 hypothetical protein TWF217_000780 [Orbilia oligospora]KAF3249338.1 hypothetical protein TWF128_007775 [Orbilia oligospora]
MMMKDWRDEAIPGPPARLTNRMFAGILEPDWFKCGQGWRRIPLLAVVLDLTFPSVVVPPPPRRSQRQVPKARFSNQNSSFHTTFCSRDLKEPIEQDNVGEAMSFRWPIKRSRCRLAERMGYD